MGVVNMPARAATQPRSFELRGASDIFAELPPTPWVSRDLQMCPGRPVMIAGYGASAKTLTAQSLAMSYASGSPIWGQFECLPGKVIHLDYEQGWHATAKRYQRLARGMQLGRGDVEGRLFVAALPEVNLCSAHALDAYCAACDGAGIVIIDALRGAAPDDDENDSAIRSRIDLLTRVSERTRATIVLLHHAGKPKDGHSDTRTVARGSSAIFDACGCVLLLTNRKKGEPRLVQQVKTPAEAEGGAIADFELMIEDVRTEDVLGGVRVMHRAIESAPKDTYSDKTEADDQHVWGLLQRSPGVTLTSFRPIARKGRRMSNQDVADSLERLVHSGRVTKARRDGKGGGELYWPTPQGGS